MGIQINDTTPWVQYTPLAAQVVFTIPFEFFEDDDIQIYFDDEETPESSSNYSLVGANTNGTKEATFTTAPESSGVVKLTIVRDTEVKRSSNFAISSDWTADNVNNELNRLTMMVAERELERARSVELLDTFGGTFSTKLPADIDTANKVLGVNSSGDGFEMFDSLSTSASNAADSAAAALVSENNAATSENNAATSETNSSVSAAAAQAAADSVAWEVVTVVAGDSPVTAEAGRMYVCTTTAGAITINLPSIAAVGEPTSIAVRKETGDANAVTVSPDGTDEINGTSSYVIDGTSAHSFYADIDATPDNWAGINMGGTLSNPFVELFEDTVDFTANISTSVTFAGNISTENAAFVSFNGLTQHHDTYAISGQTLSFHAKGDPGTPAVVPTGTDTIELHYFETVAIGVPADASVSAAKLTGPMYQGASTDNDGSFDLSAGNDFRWTPTGADQLQFTNKSEGQRGQILLVNASNYAITFEADIYGPTDAATDLSVTGTYLISYWCTDGVDGTDVYISYSAAMVDI
jgi:hypothetical protein